MATLVKKPTTLYRDGDRTPPVRDAKNADHRVYRRAIASAVFGPVQRARVLDQLRGGTPLPEAARGVSVTAAQVHGRARWDPEFRAALDDALDAYSAPFKSDKCGTATGYRNRCRCRPCRTAHAAETDRYR